MKHSCTICNTSPMRIDAYKLHLCSHKHTINQAIYDGQLKAVYEKEKEEWDKERANLLKINKGDIENSISLLDINTDLRRQIEMYQENERMRETKEDNQAKSEKIYLEKLECIANKHILLEKEKEQWLVEKKVLEKKIRLMSQNHTVEIETIQYQNTEFIEQIALLEAELKTLKLKNEVIKLNEE